METSWLGHYQSVVAPSNDVNNMVGDEFLRNLLRDVLSLKELVETFVVVLGLDWRDRTPNLSFSVVTCDIELASSKQDQGMRLSYSDLGDLMRYRF